MPKQNPTPTQTVSDKPLSQLESRWLADHLRERGVSVKDGLTFARLRPSAIVKRYDISLDELIEAVRRSQ